MAQYFDMMPLSPPLPTLSQQEEEEEEECEKGISITPCQGDAIIFWSVTTDGISDANAAHAAEPVQGTTPKYIATKWCYPMVLSS